MAEIKSSNKPVFSNIRDLGPADFADFAEQCVSFLPEDLRFRLQSVIETFPREGDTLQRVLELVRCQWEGLQSSDWIQIALVGPAGTGKSTLLRAIRGGAGQGDRPIFSVFDRQGLEEFLGYSKWRTIPDELKDADVILLVLDASYSFTDDTLQMARRLASLGKTFFVVLNKIDRVDRARQVVGRAKKFFGAPVLPVSSFRLATVDRLLKTIVSADSRALHPLARNLPHFRNVICNGIVGQASFAAGLVGAVPIPVSDLLPIAGIQTGMVLKVARVYGFRIDRGRARELLPIFASGLLIREAAHALRSRFPEQKRLIATSVAGLWTYLIGRTTVSYFERLTGASASVSSVADEDKQNLGEAL